MIHQRSIPRSMKRELAAALEHLRHLGHQRALQPGAHIHTTTPEAEASSCTIRISAEEASLLWAAGCVALLLGSPADD